MTSLIIVALIAAVLISLLWIVGLYAEKDFDSHFTK